jgi:hypothetical protein
VACSSTLRHELPPNERTPEHKPSTRRPSTANQFLRDVARCLNSYEPETLAVQRGWAESDRPTAAP